jgi:glycosyltransferase involved in cell wall biosynthesis
MNKLAIITTHPIQYNAPLFRLLHERNNLQLKVFYTWSQTQTGKLFDPGFGISREWDIPLLNGYNHSFIKNISFKPGSSHFFGIINIGLFKAIKKYKPDAILVYGWSFLSHLLAMIYFKGKIPIYFRGDSTLLDEDKMSSTRRLLRRIILRKTLTYIDYALYTGFANLEYYIAHGLKQEHLFWVPHSIDNSFYNGNEGMYKKLAAAWRERLGIQVSDIVFLFSGKLETKKNPTILLKAFLRLNTLNAKLIFVGNGHLENELKTEAKNHTNILFIDFQNQSQMPVVYRLGDILILPSSGPGETWGLAVNEGMACGKPIIVSNKCGCSFDLIKENGFVFKSDNIDDLIDKMQYFIKHKEMIEVYGSRSREIIESWDLSNSVTEIENIICR